MLRRRIACLAALAAAWGVSADLHAAPAKAWERGTIAPGFHLGFGYRREVTQLTFGADIGYYIIDGLALDLRVSDTVLLYSNDLRARYDELREQVPTNMVRVTPIVRYVFRRKNYRFSPYAQGGVGPTFLNHGHGAFGHWSTGPGAYIGLVGPMYLDVSVEFFGTFPPSRCNDSFVYSGPAGEPIPTVEGFCGFGWGPRVGLTFAFGTK